MKNIIGWLLLLAIAFAGGVIGARLEMGLYPDDAPVNEPTCRNQRMMVQSAGDTDKYMCGI